MIDLTEALNAIPTRTGSEAFFQSPGDWTADRLRKYLDDYGIKHAVSSKSSGPVYNLDICPFCHDVEGNPAIWLRDGVARFKCHRAKHCGDKSFADLETLLRRPKLARINALELPGRFPRARQSVVHGLIRRGDVANVIGGPKARKSFLMMQLALSIASGTQWLAWQTVQGRVLLIDNELRGDDLANRLTAMAEAMGLAWESVARNIDLMPLRGTPADLYSIRDELSALPPDTYSLVIIDALYKALPRDVDENSNSDMTAAYVALDQSAERQNCATAVVHHTSKGAQHAKSVSDMGSGAGAQSRSADAHIVLREHEDPDTVVLQAIVRSQRPVEPVCLTFDYPIWRLAPDKNPQNVSVANRKPTPTIDAFLAAIPADPEPKSDVLAAAKLSLGCTGDAIKALLREAIARKLVQVDRPANRALPHTIKRVKQ